MPETLSLLINPIAGEGHPLDRWPQVERILATRGIVTRMEPVGEHALAAAVRAAADAGATIVVAGGDGTVNRVVNALDGRRATLGIVPVGSGNDLARALGIPMHPVRAAERIVAGTPAPIDLVSVNGQRFCTVGGVGLMADVATRVARLAQPGRATRRVVRRLGAQAYLLMGVVRLLAPTSRAEHVRIEGEGPDGSWTWEGACRAALVANQPTLGAGLALPVEASATDGVCEVCIVPRSARVSLALRLASLRTGHPQPEHVLTVRRARRASITVERVVPFAADGDVLCMERRFDVVVRPGAVNVLR